MSQKMAEAKRCTIISLYNHLNGMMAWTDLTRSSTIRMKHSVSGTYYFLEEQFRFMPRAVISLHGGTNSQSVCICVILKPRCRYNLCTCMIPYEMFSIFLYLIILPAANMMCRDMVLRNPSPLMCIRS